MTSSDKMISRRQIIKGQQQQQHPDHVEPLLPGGGGGGGHPSGSSQSGSSSGQQQAMGVRQQHQRGQPIMNHMSHQHQQQQHQAAKSINSRKIMAPSSRQMMKDELKQQQQQHHQQQQQQQQDSSDGYIAASSHQYQDYAIDHSKDYASWRQDSSSSHKDGANSGGSGSQQSREMGGQNGGGSGNYHPFDPYYIDTVEEDVWFSEERLFEDHLEEIFNKWRLLDDDIWCKLIIMERNRRIGKAYARVPIVTIDGSHEQSYDGYKLALNGFDNPDRDTKTEECRKRIGKGIRIKMDNFGNILIKRLSKNSVFIKDWISTSTNNSQSSSSNGGGGGGRLMPSRQQLIQNQNDMMAGMVSSNGGGRMVVGGSQLNSSSMTTSVTPSSGGSSGGSSMEPPNDSAICDEVISVGGRLDQDKIYVMFDMKKFQANVNQELCRPYPDRRKLEQQCFSIIGLARDADEILDLPCWVMVINIVAIELLNKRFPSMMNNHTTFPDTMLLDSTNSTNHHHHHLNHRNYHRGANHPPMPAAPNFVSIFEHNGNHDRSSSSRNNKDENNKEEDPYSLPANASSSDVKSSINDYGTASTKNMMAMDSNGAHHQQFPPGSSRYNYNDSKRAEMYAHRKDISNRAVGHPNLMDNMKHRSRSNGNIFGPLSSSKPINSSSRYNNGQSIYSPGHMLVPHPPPQAGDSAVPPKLPPRDFVKKGKSKSSSNVNIHEQLDRTISNNTKEGQQGHLMNDEAIYSTGLQHPPSINDGPTTDGAKVRKTKKNRFLESLKAPLELAKSSRSVSVMGSPVVHNNPADSSCGVGDLVSDISKKLNQSGKPSSSSKGFSKTGAKNLKSFLGVKGSKSKDKISDDSEYVHVDNVKGVKGAPSARLSNQDSAEADSVVDSNEDLDDGQQVVASQSSASYNDLDIPTPDYETDENIYALEVGNGRGYRGEFQGGKNTNNNNNNSNQRSRLANSKSGNGKNLKNSKHNKDDLYYSGFLAHVPQNINGQSDRPISGGGGGNKSSLADNTNDNMSCLSNKRDTSRFMVHNNNKMVGLSGRTKGRDMIYGSTIGLAPMQPNGLRYRSASMQRYYTRSQVAARSQSEMYDLETEIPYAMSGGVADVQGHYGVTTGGGVGGHRRRSGSRAGSSFANINGGVGGAPLHRVGSSMANSNYDIGRSSSGIYGNNSSSSSSDYADWHPQMRKVNSSGYLNSVFKNHLAASPLDPFNTNPLNNNNNMNNNINSNPMAVHCYNNNNNNNMAIKQQRNGASRTLKTGRPASTLSKQQQQQQIQQQQKAQIHQVPSGIVNGTTAYRSYDSSNDSEPSYTNSSDGLDIYDHIGAAQARSNHLHDPHHHHHHPQHHQFLDLPIQNNITPEVHVGEWENMYER